MEVMPYTRDGVFVWEHPAHVLAVLDGASFLADIDLGFNVHTRSIVIVDGLVTQPTTTAEGLAARKEAQKLLRDADLVLKTKKLAAITDGRMAVLADVAYSPWHEPRGEQASFVAAMLATGLVKKA